jgi:hypothetical protein
MAADNSPHRSTAHVSADVKASRSGRLKHERVWIRGSPSNRANLRPIYLAKDVRHRWLSYIDYTVHARHS